MEPEKKRMIALGVLIALAIIGAVVYSFWGNVINRGTLVINGAAPFHVEIFHGDKFDCNSSPCTVTQRTGLKELIISREGYESIIVDADVKLWRETELTLDFELIPDVTVTDVFPDETALPAYELVIDDNTRMQKLVKSGDPIRAALAFFPTEMDKTRIFGSKQTVLLVNQKNSGTVAYLVDLAAQKKRSINYDFTSLVNGKWSMDGRYFVFNELGKSQLSIMDNSGKIIKTKVITGISQVGWSSDGRLVFATLQSDSLGGATDSGGFNIITLSGEKNGEYYLFGFYDPAENTYSKIGRFPEIPKAPRDLVLLGNGRELYFRYGRENFKINLK